jgi:DNA topoisomerase-2
MKRSSSPPKVENKKQKTEEKYEQLSDMEHVLLRPDSYVGSVLSSTIQTDVMEDGVLVSKEVAVSPAFLQLFEEIVSNATDRVAHAFEPGNNIEHKTTLIEIAVTETCISVKNNGDGIPIDFLEEHDCYIPELIFSRLRTGSNYDDEQARFSCGRNGLGAKLTAIFSEKFVVTTVDHRSEQMYKQKYDKNLSVIKPPVITKCTKKPFTEVVYKPDLCRLGMDIITPEVMQLLHRRAHDICATSYECVKVKFNGALLPVKNFKQYVELFVGDAPKCLQESSAWRVALVVAPPGEESRNVSFCNATRTENGGTHVDLILNPVVKALVEKLKKSHPSVKPSMVKDTLSVFVTVQIVNPVFSSQVKDKLMSKLDKSFMEDLDVSKIAPKLLKLGVSDRIADLFSSKDEKMIAKTDGKKQVNITVPKLHDAAWAGTGRSLDCQLLVTEGDSALTLALSGLAVIGREKFGCFPLKGKVLNVRDASAVAITNNEEIGHLKKILGLKQGLTYETEEERKTLRYGAVVLLTDQDLDGFHIRGLLINLFDKFWPDLLSTGFVRCFNTPLVKATSTVDKKMRKLFYRESEFTSWMETDGTSVRGLQVKYLKGLGSSTSVEAKEYFKEFSSSVVTYEMDEEGPAAVDLAFSKSKAADRKVWISSTEDAEEESKSQCQTLSDFVHKELVLFSQYDVRRSIPCVVDGLKISQRKILFGCFKAPKNLFKTEMKVASLAGHVSQISGYHHGEASLTSAITAMAQDFVGSSNVNLLLPMGQLGSRLLGGSDAASPRYVFVQLNPLTGCLYRKEDLPVLTYTKEDGVVTEPEFYVPIIPMALINPSAGIGTGYSSNIPSFNPVEIVDILLGRLDEKGDFETLAGDLQPWYRGFKGDLSTPDDGRNKEGLATKVLCTGLYTVVGTKVTIKELPIGVWTSPYIAMLQTLVGASKIKSFVERCTDVRVRIEVELLEALEEIDMVKLLKLQKNISLANMHLHDPLGKITKYASAVEVLDAFYPIRLDMYEKRKAFQMRVLEHEVSVLSARLRFVSMKIDSEIIIENRQYDTVIADLKESGFIELGTSFDATDKSYDYVTKMALFDVTHEKKCKLENSLRTSETALEKLRLLSIRDMWRLELEELKSMLVKKE